MRQFKSREFRRILKDNGYIEIRMKGDHATFKKDGDTITINVVNLKPIVANRLIKEHNLKI